MKPYTRNAPEVIRADVVISVRAAWAEHHALDLANITLAGPFVYRDILTRLPDLSAPCVLGRHFT